MALPSQNELHYDIVRVFFTGTETLQPGQALCFQQNPASSAQTKGFPFDVTVPNSNNVQVFAGIVDPGSVGKAGPCFIDIIRPRSGDILQVRVSRAANVPVGTILKLNHDLDTTTATGQAGFDALAGVLTNATYNSADINAAIVANLRNLPGVVQALESVPSTATNNTVQLAWVRFV